MLSRLFRSLRERGLAQTLAAASRWLERASMLWVWRLRYPSVAPSAYGVLLKANWSDRTFVRAYRASYGRDLSDLLTQRTAPYLFVDIGANQGIFTLVAAAAPACQHVFAFEPVPETFARLVDNVALNRSGERVTAYCCGISDHSSAATISITPGHSGAATLRTGIPSRVTTEVQLRPMAEFASSILRLDLPLIVKIDVEGHEAVVIAELVAAGIAAASDAVFYEVDESWSDPARLQAMLTTVGFTRFTRIGSGTHYDVLATR